MPKILFFPYFGPNRRADRRVVEIRLDFDSEEADEFPQKLVDVRQKLIDAGVLTKEENFPVQALPANRRACYASLLAQTALLFQHKCGHRVDFFTVFSEQGANRYIALVEHQHCDVGMTAVKLAVELLNGKRQSILEPFRQFSEFARQRMLPIETGAIIKAASRRGIPYFQLEQEPFARSQNTGYRIRRNGLLSLGHGAANHILDGTFCVDQSGEYLKALLRNPDQRFALLEQLGIATARGVDLSQTESELFHLLTINRQVTATAELAGGNRQLVSVIHPALIELTLAISERAGFAPVAVSLRTSDITRPLTQTDGVVLDFDLAPDLGLLLGQCKGGTNLLDSAAADLIEWLFPDHASARMPIIAITGTNGKTTSSRMISHILQESGRKPGMVCTDGIFLNGKQISHSDAGSLIGHARVLTSKLPDVAVLEAHHRGIAVRGFAFDKCDIAVCLNVTEEHLKKGEIETVEEMSKIKRALLERACSAAVLNADDSNCRGMLQFMRAERICLVSMQSSVEKLRDLAANDNACFCVLENVEGREWLIIYDRNERLPLIQIDQVPATFDGTAAFNTSNAMHAAAATFLLGTGIEHIRSALGTFSASPELTPGRMNVFDDLPFRIIVDFAHNPDGMKKVCDFVDRQKVNGRKLIAFAGDSSRTDRANRLSAQAVAGHFDFYFCKDYAPPEAPKRNFLGPFMRQVLIEAGVPKNQTRVVTFGRDVIFSILDTCKPEDLLIILSGHVEIKTIPAYIEEYTSR